MSPSSSCVICSVTLSFIHWRWSQSKEPYLDFLYTYSENSYLRSCYCCGIKPAQDSSQTILSFRYLIFLSFLSDVLWFPWIFVIPIYRGYRVFPPILPLCCKFRTRVSFLHAYLELVSRLVSFRWRCGRTFKEWRRCHRAARAVVMT